MRTTVRLLATAIAVASWPVLADTTATGLRVYGEIWNPTRIDGESLSTLVNEPTALSDALLSTWGGFRTWYLAQVPAKLHGQDFLNSVDAKIPKGITLYARSHDMQAPPTLSLPATPQLTLTPQGTNAFAVRFHVPAAGIGLCATTPTPLGKYADPCADLSVDLDVTASVAISDVPGQLLKVSNVTAAPSNFNISDPNFPVEVLQIISDINAFFGGTDFQQLLTNMVDSQSQNLTPYMQAPVDALNASVGRVEQTALTSINKALALAGVSLPSLLHVALWEQSSAGSQWLTILLTPPTSGLTLDPSRQSGRVNGVLTFDSSVQTLPATCVGLNGTTAYPDRVQTGPRPVLSIDSSGKPTYGIAPFQPLNVVFNGGPVQARQCSYSLTGLALGLPNSIALNAGQQKATFTQRLQPIDLTPVSWGNPVIVGPDGVVLAVGAPAADRLVGNTQVLAGSQGVTAPAGGQSGRWGTEAGQLTQNNAQNSLALLASISPSSAVKIGSTAITGTSTVSRPGTVPRWGGIANQAPPSQPIGSVGSSLRESPSLQTAPTATPALPNPAPSTPSSLQSHF